MEDFIIFSNTCGGNTAIRKSEIAVIHEGDVESFEDIMAKLDE